MEDLIRIIRKILENTVLLLSTALIVFFIWYLFLQGIFIGPPVTFYSPADDSIPPACVAEYTHQTVKSEYKAGEYVTARINSIKKTNEVGFINWNLNNESGELIESYKERSAGFQKVGENKTIVPIERLPLDIKPGTYIYHGYLKYDLGFRVQNIHVETNKFTVVK